MIFIVFLTLWISCSARITREHFIAVVEEEWNYAPEGNLLHREDSTSDLYLKTNPDIPTIGSKYIKAMYREYRDETFTTRIDRPEWLGILGPFLHAEIGDTLLIHFYNNASNHNYTMHPHGVFYLKDSEGALYVDNTTGVYKADDHVPPGGKHTYKWIIHPEYGPTRSDPNCITWLVHSHQFAKEEMITGALLIMAICKPGTLDNHGKRKDVDREYPLLFMIFDENFSIYREENIRRYLGDNSDELITSNLTSFQRSNRKSTINGYLYGNLKGLEACLGDKVSFHIASIGNEEDVHSTYVQGQNMIVYHHRRATVKVFPGSSVTALSTVDNPGQWIVASQSVFYTQAGMQALFHVRENCSNEVKHYQPSLNGMTRTYFIAAEEVLWNYAPSGYDFVHKKPLSEVERTKTSFGESSADECKLNGKYIKAVFRGYTSRTFRRRIPNRIDWGILGQPIKAEVGDTVKVVFHNKASIPYSIQTYRFLVDYDENGIAYDGGPDVAVLPNQTKEYTFRVPRNVGPTGADPDCILGRYYSAVDEVRDTYAGLSGPLVICRPGTLDNRGRNVKVDREFYLMFSDFQERYSHYFRQSIQAACPDSDVDELFNNDSFIQANVMRSLNGFIYGNLEGLMMCQNDRVNWYVMSVGSGLQDLHTPYFHGNTFMVDGSIKDSYSLIPNDFATLFMVPQNPGIWSIEDQVTNFVENEVQMEFLYVVNKTCKEREIYHNHHRGKIRTYYIAAVERLWNYAPVNRHLRTGEKLSENNVSQLYYVNDPDKVMIGHIYTKALFREFTDDTFTTEKKRSRREKHLGMLGPFIKAEVYDTIRVVFKNMAKNHNFSIVPHGVFYDKVNEGYIYNDTVDPSKKKGGSVPPGETFTYKWYVPKAAGPGPNDFNCIPWAYTSHVNYARDINSGLIGPLITCRERILDEEGLRHDIEEEYALLFFIVNELGSAYIDENIREHLHKEPSDEIKRNLLQSRSIAMLSINGYIFGNVPDVSMTVGDTAAWYIISLGDTTSTHTVHWHGNTFVRRLAGTHRHDVFDVLPGDFQAVEMTAVNNGTWLLHCHVSNHRQNGMDMVYTVYNREDHLEC